MDDPYYKYHVFFCTNLRNGGKQCCENCNATTMRMHAKDRAKQMGMAIPGGVRINTAGCLNRCSEGPVVVVYPEGVWYTYVDEEDINEIVDSHLQNGKIVERLRLK